MRSWMLHSRRRGGRGKQASQGSSALSFHNLASRKFRSRVLWHSLMRMSSEQSCFFLHVGSEAGKGRKGLGWVRGRIGRALRAHQQERLPFLTSTERQGHGPCLSQFPLMSWKICKLVSSHRSSDILGALQRIILKTYNKIIEGLVCPSSAAKALGMWESFLHLILAKSPRSDGSLSWNRCGEHGSWRDTCLRMNRVVCVWTVKLAGQCSELSSFPWWLLSASPHPVRLLGSLHLRGAECWNTVRRKADLLKDLVGRDRDLQIDTKPHHEIRYVEGFWKIPVLHT